MATSVLIASPTIAFGELIRLTLEGDGNYHVTRVNTGCEALAQCQSIPFELAILDADLSDLPLPDLFTAVQKLRPGIRLVVVPPNSDPKSPIVAGLPSHGYLNKPFYLPELMSIVTRALQPQDLHPEAQPASIAPAGAAPPVPAGATPPVFAGATPPVFAGVTPPVSTGATPPVPAGATPPVFAGATPPVPTGATPPVPAAPAPQKAPGLAIDGAPFDGAPLNVAYPKRPASKPIAPTAPAWLQDVARAAQHLTRLSLETAALAALIIRDGELWAYAGQLSQPAAQELAQTVAHYWKRGNGSDLARFVHLDATDGDYMLYATSVSRDMALAMVFDTEMPFSKIRSQASYLARSLASPPGSVPPLPKESASQPPAASSVAAEQPQGEEALDLASLTPLFEDVPPALPGQLPPSLTPDMPKQVAARPLPSTESTAALRLETSPRAQPQVPQPETTMPDNAPVPSPTAAPQDILDPASPVVCHLSYACMMVPRMPQHSIEGDLAQRLSGWARQLCLAYGWRLDLLVISPDHVEWVMNVPPTASPSTMMRIFRQQTSRRIFADFPALERDNPSGDFWAPGYLIMSSGQLPPESLVKDFIKQTRRRQGVL